MVPGRHPGLSAAARLADGVRGIESIVSGKGLEPFQSARRPGAYAGQDHHRGRILGAGRQDMGVAEAGIYHQTMSFDREISQLFLIEG